MQNITLTPEESTQFGILKARLEGFIAGAQSLADATMKQFIAEAVAKHPESQQIHAVPTGTETP